MPYILYRVENVTKTGAYALVLRAPHLPSKYEFCNNYARHPSPWEDQALKFDPDQDAHFNFGFESHKDLHNWFNPQELNLLASLGAGVSKYSAEEVRFGYKQLIFNSLTATRLYWEPINVWLRNSSEWQAPPLACRQ